ncbi:DUF3164 family protein [uncultured Mucilaginibacter sp.]|uniref:DUF3164 family protein n=1 Tax=uncultured Mucilaginibacter sp. TaxID=797541 RepID=UPI0026009933|nr:DUF3164 family protein [uncultured Mucilaginibacter sp.]
MTTITATVDELTDDQLEALLNQRRASKAREQNEKRTAYEGLKEETIAGLCGVAIHMNSLLRAFKKTAFEDMQTLYALLQEYSQRHADGDGNFTIESADKAFRIEYSKQERGGFDERSVQAEKHIIDFVNKQFAGDPTTHQLITSLLERKKGALDINLVQKLYSMEDAYQDENWQAGIRLLKESWNPSESKDYIRFYQKVKTEWKLINLNFASVVI